MFSSDSPVKSDPGGLLGLTPIVALSKTIAEAETRALSSAGSPGQVAHPVGTLQGMLCSMAPILRGQEQSCQDILEENKQSLETTYMGHLA